jgi:fucose permease
MSNLKIKISLYLNYFVFAILLNSVGTVMLQVQNNYGILKSSASVLEAFKDLSISLVSFLVSAYIVRIGYKNAMLAALGITAAACFTMPVVGGFAMTKILFAAVGSSFALIKMSVYSTIGLVTRDQKEHLSMMSFIESFFMIGVLTGYFIFGAFIDDANPTSTTWLQVYYFLGALSLLAFVLLWSAPLDESAARSAENTGTGWRDMGVMFKMLALPLVLSFIGCAFLYVLIEQSIMSWLPTFNKEVMKLPVSLSIQMASILSASIAAGRFFAGFLLKKYNWLYVLASCLILAAGLVMLVIPLTQNLPQHDINSLADVPPVAFAFPLIGFFLAPIYPAINSAILSALPTSRHGLMSGLIILFSALGGTSGSIITGFIFEHYGGQTAFYCSLIPISLLIVMLNFFKRMTRIDSATA